MTIEQLLQRERDKLATIRAVCQREKRDPSPGEEIEARGAQSRIEEYEQIQREDQDVHARSQRSYPAAARPAYDRAARVGNEPLTYQRGNPDSPSFFQDVYRAQLLGDPDAAGRLSRHGQEMAAERGKLSERAVSTSGVQAFVPPAYMQELWAGYARAGRPAVSLCRTVPLPATGMTVDVPQLSTPTTVGVQATQNTAVSEQNSAATQLTAPVVTIAGQNTISRQALERSEPGYDEIVLEDMAEAYAAAWDAQVLNGAGSGGEAQGILGTSGINAVTYTDAAPSLVALWPKLAAAVQGITQNRFRGPSAWLMTPARWAWMLAALDGNNRPLISADSDAVNTMALAVNPTGYTEGGPVGSLMNLPVVLDGNIPSNLGAGTNEDRIVLARWSDLISWEENGGAPYTIRAEQAPAASLGVLLVAYGYGAFYAGRYPKAVSVVSGTGLVTPSL